MLWPGRFAAIVGGLAALAQLGAAAHVTWSFVGWMWTDSSSAGGLGHALDLLAVLLYVLWICALVASGWLGAWAAWSALKRGEGAYLGVAVCLAMSWLIATATGAAGRFTPAIQVTLAVAAMTALASWVAARRPAAG